MKKKIIIDLDVVTVGIWEKEDIRRKQAMEFFDRVQNKEFHVITPFFLLELVAKWKHTQLKDSIEEFYLKSTDNMLSNEDLDEKIELMGVDDKKIIGELKGKGVKGEDSLLVLVASMFDADYLVTFNRVHLRNKKEIINEVLKKNGLKNIKIVGPEEA